MSTRLDLALHELADAAGAATTFGDPDASVTTDTVHRLAARARRGRAARGATSTAVAASAAGAVALAAPHLTRDAAPAGDPEAPPGTCRSSVTSIPSGPKDVLTVDLGYRSDDGTAQIDAAHAGAGLGTWQSGTADLVVAVSGIPDAGVGVTRLRLLVTQDTVVVGTDHERLSVVPTTTGEVLTGEVGIPGDGQGDDVPVYPLEDVDGGWWEAVETTTGEIRVAQGMELGLSGCDGSGQLAAGTYQVWATTVDSVGTARGAAGPWDLEVADDQPTTRSLPDGFPTDVPLIDGRLVTAHRHGDGWAVEIVTPGADRAAVATSLLAAAAARAGAGTDAGLDPGVAEPDPAPPYSGAGVELPGWTVRPVASQTPAEEPSVVYVLVPRD